MYKNRLQERAQKEHVDPPAYTSIQMGPQHALQFQASVRFNGAEFRSPKDVYYPTSKRAQLAAARVALRKLGPSSCVRPGASPLVMDEQNVYKNLLQELTQKAGVVLPKYTSSQSGPPHQRLFTCTVEVGSVSLQGQCARTIKNAEKNAAMLAWSVIKECADKGIDVHGNEGVIKECANKGIDVHVNEGVVLEGTESLL